MKEKLLGLWDRLTDPILSKIPRLSRPWKAVRNLVCILLAAVLIWFCRGANSLTPQWAFRRAEKSDLVGPSRVVTEEDYSYRSLSHWIQYIGETEDCYVSVMCRKQNGFLAGWDGNAVCWKKGEQVTLMAGGERWPYGEDGGYLFYLFSEESAARGEADLSIRSIGELNGRRYRFDHVYTVEFLPNEDGVLCGRLMPVDTEGDLWTVTLEECMLDDFWQNSAEIPVTVRLYDEEDGLILETSFEYRYPE